MKKTVEELRLEQEAAKKKPEPNFIDVLLSDLRDEIPLPFIKEADNG